jgi:hypothetical protein
LRRAARLLQCLWLKDRGIKIGRHVRGYGDDGVTKELHSTLSPDAARAGLNFLYPELHALVRREWLMREEGAAIDEDRLLGNAYSEDMAGPAARLTMTKFHVPSASSSIRTARRSLAGAGAALA